MSDRWRWSDRCIGQPCCGDCDQCEMEDEEDNMGITVLRATIGTVKGVIERIDRHINDAKKFHDDLVECDVNGVLEKKIERAAGRVEALHEFKQELELAIEGMEKLAADLDDDEGEDLKS